MTSHYSPFPSSLIHLTFDMSLNSNAPSPLPTNLQYLIFANNFDEPINELPPHLIFVQFGHYTQPLPSLPSSLTHLIFSTTSYWDDRGNATLFSNLSVTSNYPHPINASHCSLQYFAFYGDFNNVVLPQSVTHIKLLNRSLSSTIISSLPSSLSYLKVESSTECKLELTLWPSNLHTLIIRNSYNHMNQFPLPQQSNLRHLEVQNFAFLIYPQSLTFLHLDHYPNDIDFNILPSSITHLQIGGRFNESIPFLPLNLNNLIISSLSFSKSIAELPPNLVSFKNKGEFHQSWASLPSSLTSLKLGYFSGSFDGLPSSVTTLSFKCPNNSRSVFSIPQSVISLTVKRDNRSCLPTVLYSGKVRKVKMIVLLEGRSIVTTLYPHEMKIMSASCKFK